ncbi:MAG TPA: DUF6526 family protein [Ferruginibacter sp.]|nr:DUF6526 family protein [Ferruginibacter sp.]
MENQEYKNHSRLVPLFHFVTFGLILAALVMSCIKYWRNMSTGLGGLITPITFLLISVALMLVALFSRTFALKAQDRAIRAEESLRYFVLTGKLPDPRLTIQQMIALRFASDSEVIELAQRAVKENMKASDIKKAIKNWKGDYYRV